MNLMGLLRREKMISSNDISWDILRDKTNSNMWILCDIIHISGLLVGLEPTRMDDSWIINVINGALRSSGSPCLVAPALASGLPEMLCFLHLSPPAASEVFASSFSHAIFSSTFAAAASSSLLRSFLGRAFSSSFLVFALTSSITVSESIGENEKG